MANNKFPTKTLYVATYCYILDYMYRIVIIDDSPADSEELSRKLACFGLDIVTAMSLKGAKELLKKSSYRDIIICDYKVSNR